MRKSLLGLIVAGLLFWAGQASATTINVSNTLVNYTITDGVVTNAGGIGQDFLDSFYFVIAYDSPAGTTYLNVMLGGAGTTYEGSGGIWSPLTGNTETKYYFRKQLTVAAGVAASIGVDYMLLPGKSYLDARYFVYVNPGSIAKVRTYLVMKPNANVQLGTTVDHPGSSAWQMINDTTSSWFGGTWPNPNRVLIAGNLGFAARVADDDYMGDSVANVDTLVSTGVSLPGNPTNPAYTMTQANPGAVAMRIPTSPSYWTVPTSAGDPRYVEARLEVVPEPCTMGLMLAGLVGLGVMRRRNKKQA